MSAKLEELRRRSGKSATSNMTLDMAIAHIEALEKSLEEVLDEIHGWIEEYLTREKADRMMKKYREMLK